MTAALIIILNLIILEALLSVDNAAVLAAMVKVLPMEQRKKALTYGIVGAYVLRGLSLLFVSVLTKLIWLKIAGGIYLIWLAFKFFTKNETTMPDEDPTDDNWFTRGAKKFTNSIGLTFFWQTVIFVELMDLAFSLDNIFAAVAFTNNLTLICIGVFIGILAMRFVAGTFIKLLEKYPTLERSTYFVIGFLGVKLIVGGLFDYLPMATGADVVNSHATDLLFSFVILILFAWPIVINKIKNARSSQDNQ